MNEVFDKESKKQVFIVDDEVTNLKVAAGVLREHYKLTLLTSGLELLNVLEKSTPDLLLLDIEMPGASGFEIIKELKCKNETKNIPVIFLTAKDDVESEIKGLTLGAIDYIYKPFSPPILLKRIEHHLALIEQQKELQFFNENLKRLYKKSSNWKCFTC